MSGHFITFEGSEGCGKSTQVALLHERLVNSGKTVRLVREPGGTPIGEEIRHTLKHSNANHAMTAETEMLLMNASRAQLVREVIRPALAAGEVVLCDRFFDSTIAYQGYGRQLDLTLVRAVVNMAVNETKPHLTLLLHAPAHVSKERLASRQSNMPFLRDRIEEAEEAFFERVRAGYEVIAREEPSRIKLIDGTGSIEAVSAKIWEQVSVCLGSVKKQTESKQ